jgi:hypothetical protein
MANSVAMCTELGKAYTASGDDYPQAGIEIFLASRGPVVVVAGAGKVPADSAYDYFFSLTSRGDKAQYNRDRQVAASLETLALVHG